MANRIVRSSKFRHVFGTPAKKDQWYDNIRVTNSPHESNMSAVNAKFIAVVTEVQGGGSFLVLPLEKVGRVDINCPKVAGHKNQVLDVAWNPFNDNQIASASEDCCVMLWEIPDGGLTSNMTSDQALLNLEGHQRKVMHLQWHPCAANVLASAGADGVLFIWNIDTGEPICQIEVWPENSLIQSICWNYNGSLIASTCKDKKIRVVDARSGELLSEGSGHEGNKPSRVVFCGKNRLFTTGFSRMSDRQYGLWDADNMNRLAMENIDTASGVVFPFYDAGTNMVYLVGKGDTQIRFFEVSEDKVFFLNMHMAKDPGRSVCAMPKRHMDYMKCEVMRFFKLHKTGVEPISMTVPRKSDMFQSDIFPACPAGEPALSAEEWESGVDKDPILMEFKEGAGGAGTSKARTTAVPKKKAVQAKAAPARQTSHSASAKQEPPTLSTGEPTTLEEYHKACKELADSNLHLYRKAYKLLEEENKRLKEKLGM